MFVIFAFVKNVFCFALLCFVSAVAELLVQVYAASQPKSYTADDCLLKASNDNEHLQLIQPCLCKNENSSIVSAILVYFLRLTIEKIIT